jgi:hypothetical protein
MTFWVHKLRHVMFSTDSLSSNFHETQKKVHVNWMPRTELKPLTSGTQTYT